MKIGRYQNYRNSDIFINLVKWVIFSFFVDIGHSTKDHGHLQPIGKQRLPDLTNIDHLKYSPGGQDFYRKYLLLHKPVLIKRGTRHWPLVVTLKDQRHDDNGSSPLYLPVKHGNLILNESIANVKDKKLEVDISLTKDSEILEAMRLPFILQCREFIDKIVSVFLRINKRATDNIQYSNEDEIIVALDEPVLVIIFGSNKTLSGESIKSVNMSSIDIEKYPHVTNIPYQLLECHPGDLLYIPKYSWYHIRSLALTSYVKISFDYVPHDFQSEIPYLKALDDYKQVLSSLPTNIECNNTKISFKNCLSSNINFKDPSAVSHLRIPKKNEKPQDITLASGYKMPVLGLGTALLNESTYDAVKCALNTGYRLFDLAYGYPFSETSFSKALSESSIPREEVFVATKLHPRFLGFNETLYAIDESLKRLNVSYIDLYFIHSKICDDFLLKCEKGEPRGTWKESWRAMEHAVKLGKIRSLGVSNFYKKDIYQLLNWAIEPVSVVQNWFDPFNPDKETRKICTEYNIRFMGYSTLGNYWKMIGLEFNPVFQSSTITAIAANYDYVISSVVLRWAIHENVTVIPRSSNPIHIAQNFRALDLSLRPDEIEVMNTFDDWMTDYEREDTENTV